MSPASVFFPCLYLFFHLKNLAVPLTRLFVDTKFSLCLSVQQLKERLENLEDSFLCCICMSRPVGMVLCPCGHMTCSECAPKISECPLCRTEVERRQKVFIPGFSHTKETDLEGEESAGEMV